uniref:Ty3 transposon capsid-like protein domain-containing protein n=1 Tax=Heliothis virescens TaxID=7102 RepID=A0A2A4JBU6_HELVI
MPTTRSQVQETSDNVDASAGAASMNVTMTHETLVQLLREVRSSTPHNVSESSTFGASGNFAKCRTRYGGRQEESLENFLDAIITYKECVNMTDENALRGFSMLLEGPAAVWWQGVKRSTGTWSEALSRIKGAFAEHDPPHRLYKKLFALVQEEEHTDLFIAKVRALLAKLPKEDLSEKVQLDMAFGLLSPRIRKRVTRESFTSFDELLKKCRTIEDSLKESSKTSSNTSQTKSQAQTSVRATSSSSPQPPPSDNTTGAAESAESVAVVSKSNNKPFCVYCKRSGHSKNACEKLKRNVSDRDNNSCNSGQKLKSEIKCYGCGAPNVIKSKCKNCSSQQAFYSVENASHSGVVGTLRTPSEPRGVSPRSPRHAQRARRAPRGRLARSGPRWHVARQPPAPFNRQCIYGTR